MFTHVNPLLASFGLVCRSMGNFFWAMGSSTYILRVFWFSGLRVTVTLSGKGQRWKSNHDNHGQIGVLQFSHWWCLGICLQILEALERGRVQAADSTLLGWEYKYELHHMPRSYHPFCSFLAVCRLLSIILQKLHAPNHRSRGAQHRSTRRPWYFFFPARVCPVTTSHRLIELAAKWLNTFGQTETLQNFGQI